MAAYLLGKRYAVNDTSAICRTFERLDIRLDVDSNTRSQRILAKTPALIRLLEFFYKTRAARR